MTRPLAALAAVLALTGCTLRAGAHVVCVFSNCERVTTELVAREINVRLVCVASHCASRAASTRPTEPK